MQLTREELLMKLGAARDQSRTPWRLAVIEVAADSATFSYRLDRNTGPNGTHASSVRETCARIILRRPKYQVVPFLTRPASKKGKWEQARRTDGARAYRTHIAKSHEALRLMYWDLRSISGDRPGSFIEFANVGARSELVILPGTVGAAISGSW
jgi:hypothetical protein